MPIAHLQSYESDVDGSEEFKFTNWDPHGRSSAVELNTSARKCERQSPYMYSHG
jgi:hypothetical protein